MLCSIACTVDANPVFPSKLSPVSKLYFGVTGLQNLAPRAQKSGLVIRAYVPVELPEKLGAQNNLRSPSGTISGMLSCSNYLYLVNSKSSVFFFLYKHVKE